MVAERMSRTKIVATLGPASSSPERIEELLLEGVDVFRLNFSHGSHESHDRSIQMIREQCNGLGVNRAILADLQGPKVRTGRTPDDRTVHLDTGSILTIVAEPSICTEGVLSTDYPALTSKVSVGQLIMLNDGAIRLEVERVLQSGGLSCRVLSGGATHLTRGSTSPTSTLGFLLLGRRTSTTSPLFWNTTSNSLQCPSCEPART